MSYKAFTRFKCLVRDQEVDGSNPFAPTTSFKANNLQRRKVPTTSWLCAKRSVVQMSSPNDLHFPLQIGAKELRRNNFTLVAACSSTSVASCAWTAQGVSFSEPISFRLFRISSAADEHAPSVPSKSWWCECS